MDREQLLARLHALKPWLKDQGVASVSLFGSRARGVERLDSDIDLVVTFAHGRSLDLFEFSGLRLELERRLGARVDLFTPESLPPALRKTIEATAIHA